MALYDQLALLLHLLREALHVCSPHGKLRTQAHVRSELLLLFDMIEALDGAAMSQTLKPLRLHLDDLLVPFKQAEAIDAELHVIVPHDALDCLVLAWHHDHFVHQSRSKHKGYHQSERAFWLACAEGLLGDAFETLNALVVDKLDSIIRASSLVEMVNGLIRPYLNSCKGQITQETLNLIMFYHNHRRYKSGKRQGKAPFGTLDRQALRGAVVGAFTPTGQHRAGRLRPWHCALKTAASPGAQQRWVYGSTGDGSRPGHRRPYRCFREPSPPTGL